MNNASIWTKKINIWASYWLNPAATLQEVANDFGCSKTFVVYCYEHIFKLMRTQEFRYLWLLLPIELQQFHPHKKYRPQFHTELQYVYFALQTVALPILKQY